MAEIKKYLSDNSLNTLVDKIKSEDAKVLKTAKEYAEQYSESLSTNYDSAGSAVTAEQNAKNYTDTELADYYDKTEIDETTDNIQTQLDGKMSSVDPVGSGSFSIGRKDGTEIGYCSVTTGSYTTASGYCSHAEGNTTTASGRESHAEGNNTTASGNRSHAEGYYTTASGVYSHAEGYATVASGYCSHAEGTGEASGDYSHAEGNNIIASGDCSHVQGKYNVSDDTFAHIVGNGESNTARSNAHTLDWDGNAWFAGDVYVGSTSGINKDEGSKKLATIDDTKIFVATHGVTTFDEVMTAYQSGKVCVVQYNNRLYQCFYAAGSQVIYFVSVSTPANLMYIALNSSSGWSTSTVTDSLELAVRKQTSITDDNSSSTAYYPSISAVVNYVTSQIGAFLNSSS